LKGKRDVVNVTDKMSIARYEPKEAITSWYVMNYDVFEEVSTGCGGEETTRKGNDGHVQRPTYVMAPMCTQSLWSDTSLCKMLEDIVLNVIGE
jgi:hypothetical protein